VEHADRVVSPVEGIRVKPIGFAISRFYITATLFLLNLALGLPVQVRVVDTKPIRRLHQALFFMVFVSAAAGTLAGFLSRVPYR
jgi:hypothetical protein